MTEQFSETLVVERVHSQLAGGTIFTGRRTDGTSIRVRFSGRTAQPEVDDVLLVSGLLGAYQDRFGRSVQQVTCKRMRRVVQDGQLLHAWLQRLPNVGEVRAARLLQAYGHDLPNVLTDISNLQRVAAVIEPSKPALASKIAAQVFGAMASRSGSEPIKQTEAQFLVYLERLGLRDARLADSLWRAMAGADAIERLHRNPYVPACFMSWERADRVGQRLLRHTGVQPEDLATHPARLAGAMTSVWQEILARGDTAAPRSEIEALLQSRGVSPGLALKHAEESRLLRPVGDLLRAPGAAWMEDQTATMLLAVERQRPAVRVPSGEDLGDLIRRAEHLSGLHLTAEQSNAAAEILSRPLAVLQGGAGVGKTTVMRVIATAWELLDGDIALGAVAGKAAQTLARGASAPGNPRQAYTVARLIGLLQRRATSTPELTFMPLTAGVTLSAKTLLILDEAGTLDTASLHRLMSLLPAGVRLLLLGDDGQLPPVGFGQIFHDLVTDGTRVSTLTTILRQASDSAIPIAANSIRQGYPPDLTDWRGQSHGIFVAPSEQLSQVLAHLRGCDVLTVAATRATVEDINLEQSAIRRASDTPVRRLGSTTIVAAGDPIVVTANRYAHELANGLLGQVVDVSLREVSVQFDGESQPRSLPAEAEGDIELAYGITCHKAQGSSSQAVVVVLENIPFVTREWLYTAVTRGRELVILVGHREAIRTAMARRTQRTTGFTIAARTLCIAQN